MPTKTKSPKSGTPAAKRQSVHAPPAGWRVRIRMHRQGVGDCFLVTFRNDDRLVHMLIDCGVLPGSPREYNLIEEVAVAVRDEVTRDGGKLAALVVTHEHADHVSGFKPGSKTAKALDAIPVDEVWMAWTEDPDDSVAQQLNGQLAVNAIAAASALPQLRKASAGAKRSRFQVRVGQSAEDITAILDNFGVEDISQLKGKLGATRGQGLAAATLGADLSTTVRAAMNHVKSRVPDGRFKKFLPGALAVIPGISGKKVRVFVLGPPRTADLKKNPRHGPKDDIFHLARGDLRAQARGFAAAAGLSSTDECSQPFTKSDFKKTRSPSPALGKLQAAYRSESWRSIDEDWLLAGGEFAIQLNSATNNSSLVLAIELVETGEVLLFPGDAQVENWETWRDLEWSVPDASGTLTKVHGEDLLKRTVFYKVGHHGSHNGSLHEHGVNLMPGGTLVAMCPVVHAVTSQRKGDWKEIPKPSLCTALQQKCGDGFLRMDAQAGTLGGRLAGRVQENRLWVDYYLV